MTRESPVTWTTHSCRASNCYRRESRARKLNLSDEILCHTLFLLQPDRNWWLGYESVGGGAERGEWRGGETAKFIHALFSRILIDIRYPLSPIFHLPTIIWEPLSIIQGSTNLMKIIHARITESLEVSCNIMTSHSSDSTANHRTAWASTTNANIKP